MARRIIPLCGNPPYAEGRALGQTRVFKKGFAEADCRKEAIFTGLRGNACHYCCHSGSRHATIDKETAGALIGIGTLR